jgi:hypothetical protein
VHGLPEQEVGYALLAAGADDQVTDRLPRCRLFQPLEVHSLLSGGFKPIGHAFGPEITKFV